MGKSSKPVVGYQYLMTLQMGLCTGPVDKLCKILGDKKVMWSGSINSSTSIAIDKPNLYGGEKKEGGVQGQLDVCMGEATQAPNAKLLSLLGAPLPAFRGLCTLVFDGMVGAMNPYIKAWAFQVQRFTAGWRTDVWQPSLCQIDDGANGAHIIYRAITDPVTGLGRDPSALDLDRMLIAAQTLYNEGLGLCLRWTRSDVLSNFVQVVNDHCGAMFVDDPTTGKQYMKLLRGDYDIDAVPLLDESNVIDIGSAEEAALSGTVNQVTVTYHDSATNKDAAVTVQNTANIALQGRVVEQSNSYSGLWNHDLAVRTAMRDLKAVSSLPWRFQNLKVQATDALRDVRKGDVVAFSWKDLNIVKMPLRILEIQRGGPTSHAITFTAAQDVYSLPDQTYVVVQPSLWTEPDLDPHPVAAQLLVEASYRDLATQLRPADLAQLDTTSGFVGALGVRPTSSAYGYDLWTRIGASGAFTEVGSGAFAPTGLLQSGMAREAGPTAVVLTNGVDLDQVQIGSEALVDNELCRVTAINPTALTCTLARGCVDTVPALHSAGARVWFTDLHVGADPTEYATGETINAQLLTRAGNGTLDPADATIASVQLNERQARPYPPANVLINGVAAPASINAPLTVTFARRNRLTQADQLLDTAAGDTAPETNQTTTLQVFDHTGANVHEEDGITGTASTAWAPSASANFSIKLLTMRDGLQSWQTVQSGQFTIVVPITFSLNFPPGTSNTSYSGSITASGGSGGPFTYAVSPALPAGLSLNSSTGAVTGTPTAASDATYTFTAQDSAGASNSVTVHLVIADESYTLVSGLQFEGPNNSTTFTDDVAGNSWTANAGAKISTAWHAGGSSAGLFGSGAYIAMGGVAGDWAWLHNGTRDFKIDLQIYPTASGAGALFDTGGAATASVGIYIGRTVNNSITVLIARGTSGSTAASITSANNTAPANAQTSIEVRYTAAAAAGHKLTLYINGADVGHTDLVSPSSAAPKYPPHIGYDTSDAALPYTGYIDDMQTWRV